ncbi:MAG: MtrAB system histidine kinase MtrB [Actinomycetes bacterium]
MKFFYQFKQSWNKSLSLRIISTTFIVSTVLVTIIGLVLINRVSTGILSAKESSSLTEASSAINEAQKVVTATDTGAGEPTLSVVVDTAVTALAVRAGQSGLYDVLFLASSEISKQGLPERGTNLVSENSVSDELKSRVEQTDKLLWAYTEIKYLDGRNVPGLVVGAPIQINNVGTYSLFLLFPLDKEEETIGIIRSAVLATGIFLIFGLLILVWYLTRSVLAPVRKTANAAEKLRMGLLNERVPVSGEDDLAKLAGSFNSMAASIQQQIGQLEQMSRLQKRFVSDVSHELRTPLTTVRMAADVLYESRDQYTGETARAAELLSTQIERFEILLSQLLEISRFDAGVADLSLTSINIKDLIEKTADSLSNLLAKQETPVVITGTAPNIDLDQRRIERVLRNLISNASEYGEGKPIEVEIGSDDDAIAVVVKDKGAGLKPGESSLVFNRFWRADPARARTTGGTGLGLAIALEDARLHSGWLDAWGAPGKGTMFRLTLPRNPGKSLAKSPLSIGVGDDEKLELDMTALQELLMSEQKKNQ